MDEERRCALPGCDAGIRVVPGRPERRYCTPRHREAARRSRRAAMQLHRAAAGDLAGTLPWLRHDRPAPDAAGPVLRPGAAQGGRPPAWEVAHSAHAAEPGVVAREATRRTRQGRRPDRPRRRALAVIGVAGILTGGYAVATHPDPPTTAAPAPNAPGDGSVDAWAQRAAVTLAAVNRQLDALDRAETGWERLRASRRGDVPPPVEALRERRAVLEQRRTTLRSQLDAYRSLQATRRELDDSEQHLRTVEQALAAAPPADRRTVDQEAAAAALTEQRDLRVRQRDAQRAEVAGLERGVASAARVPIPDDADATARVSREVLDLVAGGGSAGPTSTGASPEPGTSEPAGPRATAPRRPTATTRPSATPTPAGRSAPPSATAADDVLDRLHEQAREVARQARRSEAAHAPDADDDAIEERNTAPSARPHGLAHPPDRAPAGP